MCGIHDKLWTISDVSDFLQVKESIIRYWIRTSGLPHIKIGKQIRFDQRDVQKWVKFYKSASFGVDNDGEIRRIT